MLKLKLQYFGHMMRRFDSLEKTLMLGKIEGRRRRGRQRMRWLDGITNSMDISSVQFSRLLSRVWLFVTPWGFPVHHQLPEPAQTPEPVESVMPSNHLILCCPLLLLPSIFPSIRVVSNESVLCIRWPSIGGSATDLSMNIQSWFPLGLTGLSSLQSKGFSRIFSSTTVQNHQFFGAQPSLWSNSHICTWLLEKP